MREQGEQFMKKNNLSQRDLAMNNAEAVPTAEPNNEGRQGRLQEVDAELGPTPENVEQVIVQESQAATPEEVTGKVEPNLPTEAELKAAESEFTKAVPPDEREAIPNNINEGLDEFARKQTETQKEAAEKASPLEMARQFFIQFRDHFEHAATKINELLNQNLPDEARRFAKEFLDEKKRQAEQYFGDKTDKWFKEYDELMTKAEGETEATKKQKIVKLAIEGIDFIPVIGSMKMISESAKGQTFNGKKLDGWKRALHGVSGATFLALDLTGIGALGRGVKASKLFTRSAALMKKIGISRKVYKPVYKVGTVIAKNPTVAKAANKVLLYQIHHRNKRRAGWGRSVVDTIGKDQNTQAQAA